MYNLIIESNRCRLECIKEEIDYDGFLWALDKELSYNVQGAQFTRAYKGYMDPFEGKFVVWDGKSNFLDEDDLSFPSGLKQRVISFFENNNVKLNIVDKRPAISKRVPIDISATLSEKNIIPRPYQIDAMLATRENERGIIRAPTGAGKSLISVLITADIGKKTCIFVIGKDLLYQFKNQYEQYFNRPIGIIGDGHCDVKDITIATIWSVGCALGIEKNSNTDDFANDEKKVDKSKYDLIKNWLGEQKLIIFDECHMAACNTVQVIVDNLRPEHIYGMSASPWRDDGADMLIECVLGHKIIDISATDLIDNEWLVRPLIKFIRVPKYKDKLKKSYPLVYRKYITENTVRNNLIIKSTLKMIERGYKPLVLFNSIKHGKILYDLLSEKVPCVLLSGKDSIELRKKAKEDIESGKIKAIIASKIFDIGVDIPVLSGLVVAGGGKSSVRALQRIGRVIRKAPNKKQAVVVDFIDTAYYLKNHSQARKKIYEIEKGFIVKWPNL